MKLAWNGVPIAETTDGTENTIKSVSEKEAAEAELKWNKFCLEYQVQIFALEVKD